MKFEEILPEIRKGRRFRPVHPMRDDWFHGKTYALDTQTVLEGEWELEPKRMRLSDIRREFTYEVRWRRRSWPADRIRLDGRSHFSHYSPEDLEADDWEIVE